MDTCIKVRIEMTRDELTYEQAQGDNSLSIESVNSITSSSKGLGEARFIETVAVIAAVTVSILAKRIVDHWLKSQEQGVQIDLRSKPPTISTIAKVPHGFLIIINKDGKAKLHKIEYEKGEDLTPLLTPLLTQD